jgi:hypothetical protein
VDDGRQEPGPLEHSKNGNVTDSPSGDQFYSRGGGVVSGTLGFRLHYRDQLLEVGPTADGVEIRLFQFAGEGTEG